MSHVADGELHAWLDGALAHEAPERAERVAAHLKGCGDCRARLEEAREVRDRAGEILAAAAPRAAGMPPFEELEERAAAGGKGSVSRVARRARGLRWGSGPLRGLAWAASLLIGVGLGWAGRAAWQGGGDEGTVAVAERPTLAAPAPERRSETAAADEEAGPAEDAVTAPAEEAVTAPAEEAVTAPLADRAALGADATVGEGDGDAAPGEVWIAAAGADAARWIGGRLLVVEGLPVVEVAVSTREGVPVARARQRLATGGLVEVHQRPAEVAAAKRGDAQARPEVAERTTAREAPAAPAETSAVVDGLRVRLRAPVAPDSLGVLLSRLRSRGP